MVLVKVILFYTALNVSAVFIYHSILQKNKRAGACPALYQVN